MFEIYVKNKNSKYWNLAIEVTNSWGGMPNLWMFLEKKYLPSYVPPKIYEFVVDMQKRGEYVSRWYFPLIPWLRKDIEDLQNDYRLSYEEMMVFRSTFDFAMVLGEDIPAYLDCLKVVADECKGNYPDQYKALSDYIKTHNIENIEAIAFNQTSCNCVSNFFGDDCDAPISAFWNVMCSKDLYNNLRNDYKNKEQ